MRVHIVIADDPRGTLTVHQGVPATGAEIGARHLQGHGDPGRVYPDRRFNLAAWVGSAAFGRNPVAACVVASMGGRADHVAGPVVFTGWAFAGLGVPAEMTPDGLDALDSVYRAVLEALGRPEYEGPHLGGRPAAPRETSAWATAAWREDIRKLATAIEGDPDDVPAGSALWLPRGAKV